MLNMDTKWILKLDKLPTQNHVKIIKSIEKTNNFTVCRYTIVGTKKPLLLSLYSKDGFKTLDHAQVYFPQTGKTRIYEIKKAIPYDLYQKVLNILKKVKLTPQVAKTIIQKIKKLVKGKGAANESAVLEGMMMGGGGKATEWSVYFMLGFYFLTVFFLLISFAKQMKLTAIEATVDAYEKMLTEKLFKMQTGKEPEFEVYADLIHFIETICKNSAVNGLIVYGPPGTGKTYVVRRTLYFNKAKYIILKGAALSPLDVYAALFKNNGKIIVLDDFDINWSEEYLGILKAATDTQRKRLVSFPTVSSIGGQGGERYDVPKAFIFTGKIIMLTNKDKNAIPSALRSRCPSIEVAFKVDEMIDVIQKMLKFIHPEVDMAIKQEVMKFLLQLYSNKQLKYIDFRTIELGISIRRAFPDAWKSMIVQNMVG